MYFVLSPTKKMKQHLIKFQKLQPSHEILSFLQQLTKDDIKAMMKINDKIATEVYSYYQNFELNTTAIYSYCGLQYQQLKLATYNHDQIDYLENHIRILSALFGVVKPFDTIALYRLEMNSHQPFNLYDYWQAKIMQKLKNKTIVSLASDEYEKVLDKRLDVVKIVFYTEKNGQLKKMATDAKIARGQFIDQCIQKMITAVAQLKTIEIPNYYYSSEHSSEKQLVFIKKSK